MAKSKTIKFEEQLNTVLLTVIEEAKKAKQPIHVWRGNIGDDPYKIFVTLEGKKISKIIIEER